MERNRALQLHQHNSRSCCFINDVEISSEMTCLRQAGEESTVLALLTNGASFQSAFFLVTNVLIGLNNSAYFESWPLLLAKQVVDRNEFVIGQGRKIVACRGRIHIITNTDSSIYPVRMLNQSFSVHSICIYIYIIIVDNGPKPGTVCQKCQEYPFHPPALDKSFSHKVYEPGRRNRKLRNGNHMHSNLVPFASIILLPSLWYNHRQSPTFRPCS